MTARDVIAEMRARANRAHPSGPDLCLLEWADRLESTLAQPSGEAGPSEHCAINGCEHRKAGFPAWDTTPPAPLGGLTEGEISEADIAALVAGPFMYHHKMDHLATEVAKSFDRCRELTLQNVAAFFAARRLTAPRAEGVDEAMAKRYLEAQRAYLFDLDQRQGRSIGAIHTDHVIAACMAGLTAALTAAAPKAVMCGFCIGGTVESGRCVNCHAAAPQAEAGEVPHDWVVKVGDLPGELGSGHSSEYRNGWSDASALAASMAQPAAQGGDGVREAAQALVDKMYTIHADERFYGVWLLAHNHGMPYSGPTYEAELKALTAALAPQRSERGE